MARSTQDVFEDHLALRLAGDLDTDLRRNYADDVVLLTVNSNLQGHEGMRLSAGRLKEQLPDARFEIVSKQVRGEYAFLVWRAQSGRFDAVDGADSFVVRDGKIVFQSIHYRLRNQR